MKEATENQATLIFGDGGTDIGPAYIVNDVIIIRLDDKLDVSLFESDSNFVHVFVGSSWHTASIPAGRFVRCGDSIMVARIGIQDIEFAVQKVRELVKETA